MKLSNTRLVLSGIREKLMPERRSKMKIKYLLAMLILAATTACGVSAKQTGVATPQNSDTPTPAFNSHNEKERNVENHTDRKQEVSTTSPVAKAESGVKPTTSAGDDNIREESLT